MGTCSNQESIRQQKERDGLHFPFAAPKVWSTGTTLWHTFLGSELIALLHKRQVGKGATEAHPKVFQKSCVNTTAVNYIRWHNDDAFAYHFKSRVKG